MLTCNWSTVRILMKKASFPCFILIVLDLVATCLFLLIVSGGNKHHAHNQSPSYSTSSYSDGATPVEDGGGYLRAHHDEKQQQQGGGGNAVVPSYIESGPPNDGGLVSGVAAEQPQPTSTSYFEATTRTMYNHEIYLCDGNSAIGHTCTTNDECSYDTKCQPVALDPFHLRKLYPSDKYNIDNDWYDFWSYSSTASSSSSSSSNTKDIQIITSSSSEFDPRLAFFGKDNNMQIHNNDNKNELIFDSTQSTTIMDSAFGMLISSNYPKGKGYDNVEFTTYVKHQNGSSTSSSSAGKPHQLISLWARANNNIEGHLNCNSFLGYVALWDINTGEIKFQKHYGGGVATDFMISPIKVFAGVTKWYGIKFIVSTLPNSQDVYLELYIDEKEGMNGGVWNLVHTFVDRPNEWMKASDNERGHVSENFANAGCDQEVIPDGSTILGPTHGCALEYYGQNNIVSFKNISIRNINKKEQFFCNDHPHLAIPCQTDDDCSKDHKDSKCHENAMDRFGIKQIYSPSELSNAKTLDWTSKWDVPYVGKSPTALVQPGNQDPYDARTALRGIGTIAILPEGEIHMRETSKLFISKPLRSDIDGWNNIEFTAYGKILQDGIVTPTSGLELVVRSNYDTHDGCTSSSYVARLHRSTGQASFQKVYYEHPTHGKIETVSRRSEPLVSLFGDIAGLPKDVWIGMKFVVYTYPKGTNYESEEQNQSGENENAVQLDLFVDLTDGKYGGDWKLVHTTIDYPNTWMATWKQTNPFANEDVSTFHTKTVTDICHDTTGMKDGDIILGPKNECYFMVNGSPDTIVSWKHASIRSIEPSPPHSS